MSAFAQEQLTSSIQRMIAKDAVVKLQSPDAETRGEAAIIVAAAGRLDQEDRILQLAADPEPAARHRALVALGLLATPPAITFLTQKLTTIHGRTTQEGVIQAYALGLVPPNLIDTSVARTLTLFEQGSWKRQHDCLMALLLGMKKQRGRQEVQPIQQLLEDTANQADDARALLYDLLLPMQSNTDERKLRRSLRRGGHLEQLAIVNWLTTRPPEDNKPWLEQLAIIAQRGSTSAIRAAALLALTRSRYLPALEIAAHALKNATGAECSQAFASMLTIGGASTRGALEQHLLRERNPKRLQAMISGYLAPPSKELVHYAVQVAMDEQQPIATRTAAAGLVAKSNKTRATPLLRDLFRIATTRETLQTLARALKKCEESPATLERLVDRPALLAEHGDRWRALLAAGHSHAQRHVLVVLKNPNASIMDVRTALKSWRCATVDIDAGPSAPKSLQTCLK